MKTKITTMFIILSASIIFLLGCSIDTYTPEVESTSVINPYVDPTTDSYDYDDSWTSDDNSEMLITIEENYLEMNVNRTDVPKVYIYSDDSTATPDSDTLSDYYDQGYIVVDEDNLDDYSSPDISVYYHYEPNSTSSDEEDVFVVDIRYVGSYERYVFHFSFNSNENTTSDDTITLTLEINDSNTQSSPTEKTYTLKR